MKSRRLMSFVAASLLAYATAAAGQWAWRDANGGIVFSDQPPPAGVKASQIVRQPGGAASPPTGPVYVSDQPAAAKTETKAEPKKAPVAAPRTAPKTLAERAMESRQRAQQQAEADRKASEERARKQQIVQDCERARGYLRALEDGRRVAQTDAQGNQVVIDDATRAAEVARIRARIAADCH
jgi:hypothetical protein